MAASLTCTTLPCSLHLHFHFPKFPVGALDQEAPGSWEPLALVAHLWHSADGCCGRWEDKQAHSHPCPAACTTSQARGLPTACTVQATTSMWLAFLCS